jgi:hypothetical protein
LLQGQSVASSFAQARSAVLAAWPLEADKFLLRGKGDPNTAIFEVSKVDNTNIEDVTSSTSSGLPQPPAAQPSSKGLSAAFIAREGRQEVFLGRQKEVYKVYSSLVNGCQLINISGPRGIGKTCVSVRTGGYALERGLFDRILRAELSSFDEHTSIHQLVDSLATGFELVSNGSRQWTLSDVIEKALQRWEGKHLLLIINGVVRDNDAGTLASVQALLLRRFLKLQIIVTSVEEIGQQVMPRLHGACLQSCYLSTRSAILVPA